MANSDAVVADLAKAVFAETTFHMHKNTPTGRTVEIVRGEKLGAGQ